MMWHSISPILRALMLAGAVCYLGTILLLLKRRRLTVRYALLWLLSAAALLLFALFPYIVLVITDVLGMSVPINTVLILITVFVLLLLLSHSSAVSTHAQKQKRLAQENALLEARVRRLEEQLANLQGGAAPLTPAAFPTRQEPPLRGGCSRGRACGRSVKAGETFDGPQNCILRAEKDEKR